MNRRVVVAGLNVRFVADRAGIRVRPVERRMLDLATTFLAEPVYLGVHESTNRTSFIEPSTRVMRPLNRLSGSGVARLAEWPVILARIAVEVRRSGWVYARLPSPWGFATCRIARLLRRPYWVSLHGDAAEVLALRGTGWYYRARARRADRQMRAATRSAALAMSVGSDLDKRYGRLAPRSLVFANFLHSGVPREPVRTTASVPVVLFVGGLNRRKGLPDLLAAARLLATEGRTFEVRLVGEGELKGEALRTTLPGNARVSVVGWVDAGPAMDAEFARATVLASPSTAGEGVPKVVLEAQARGVPVVATEVGGVTDLLGGGQRGFLVPPNDPARLATVLATVLDGEGDVAAKVAAAAGHMANNTFERTMERLADAVRELDPRLVDESRLPTKNGTTA